MLLEERVDAPASAAPPSPAPRGQGRPRVPVVALLLGGCVVLAALSLLTPSAPTYDPWSWIVWGREITQLDLSTTAGPSWKPLPVLFTAVFALFGDAAPDLWLVAARAGALAGLLAAFSAARRLGGGVPGGVAAAAALALAPWYLRNAAMGNSEPLLVALLLGALDRHLAGDRRAAFGLGVAAALLRPEAWPFLGLYGLWLLAKRLMTPAVVVGAGALVLALWTLPEGWGSGDFLRAAHRAQEPNANAATFAEDPVLELLRDAADMLTVPVLAGLALAIVMALRHRRLPVLLTLALAAGWLAVVVVMTADGGFSGNQRYLIPPVALAIVAAGAGAGWAVGQLTARAARPALTAIAAVALGAAFLAPSLSSVERTTDSIRYQAQLSDSLPGLVERAGGAERLRACGKPYTGPFLVPVVAWNLGTHTSAVGLAPERPGVVFRVKTLTRSRPVPSLRGLSGGDVATLALNDRWRIVAACAA
jgi:MFS family permease